MLRLVQSTRHQGRIQSSLPSKKNEHFSNTTCFAASNAPCVTHTARTKFITPFVWTPGRPTAGLAPPPSQEKAGVHWYKERRHKIKEYILLVRHDFLLKELARLGTWPPGPSVISNLPASMEKGQKKECRAESAGPSRDPKVSKNREKHTRLDTPPHRGPSVHKVRHVDPAPPTTH